MLLALLGAAVARITFSDVYLRYVKEGLRPFLIATAALLIVLGGWLVWDVLRGKDGPTHEQGNPDGHAHGKMRAAWLLVLPVFSMILIAPPALGAYSAAREQSSVAAPSNGFTFPPLSDGDPLELSLKSFTSRAIWDTPGSLAGRRFELTGFVTAVPQAKLPADLPPGSRGQWWLARLTLSCCAADAVATKVLAVDTPALPNNTWVKVTGTWIPGGGTNSSAAIPWLKVESVEPIPAPREPYE